MKDTEYLIKAKHFDGQVYRCYYYKPQGRRAYVHSSLVTPTEHGFTKILDFQAKRGEYHVFIDGRATDAKIDKAFQQLIAKLYANDDADRETPMRVVEVVA